MSTTTSSTANTAADEEAKIATARKSTRSTSAKTGTTGRAKKTTATKASQSSAHKSAGGAKTPTAKSSGAKTTTKPTSTKTAAKSTKTAASKTTKSSGTKTVGNASSGGAKKSTTKRRTTKAKKETTVAEAASGEVDVTVERDGDDVVLTIGGKKRSLDDVDERDYDPAEAAKDEQQINKETEAFSLSDNDDADEPEQTVMVAGATADPVKDYLKQIGKVALLNAVEEVDLAKRIEAGLFAGEQLADPDAKIREKDREDYEWIAEDGKVVSADLLTKAPLEVQTRPMPLWRVEFEGAWRPTFYISPFTGELVSRRHDLWRTFDFVWMFHIMDYDDRQDVNNLLIRVFTWLAVATSASGAWLLLYSFRRKRRVRKAAA